MSEWVIHFIHQRNPENDGVLYDHSGEGKTIPMHADRRKASRFDVWEAKATEMPLSHEADALDVMCRILDDGHIRSGWSVRKGRPTIYGPRPACCFTEMPLFALLDYARQRGDSSLVDCYGIALPKRELFAAGGRPVIYGLSSEHRELENEWPRLLHSGCGIAESEQYRYVAINLRDDRPIDWTHEREWRWADVGDKFECPGLPIWLRNDFVSFSRVILVVRTGPEVEQILDKLKLMRDAKGDEYDNLYNGEAILNTRAVALEDVLADANRSRHRPLRIDDLPVHELKQAVAAQPSEAVLRQVANALAKAKEAAHGAAKQWRESSGRMDVFGFAYLMITGPRSEFVEALLRLKEVNEIAMSDGTGYRLANIGGGYETQLLGEAEAAVVAAEAVLRAELPGLGTYIRTVWD